MATNVKVVGTDLRQVVVKVNPGTYLTEVLEQACDKLKVSSSKFLLKHKQRQLDLSQTFRTSGLVPGARLELVVRSNTPTPINVALQLPPPESNLFPPHGRVSEKLPSDYTIWQVLRQFESGKASAGKNLNITARGVAQTSNGTSAGSGQLYYEIPNVVLEKRTLSTFVDFQKTLSQLGYNSGSVLMRLSFQKTEKTLADAMAEIGQYFKTEEEEATAQKQAADASAKEELSGDSSTAAAPTPEIPTPTTDSETGPQGSIEPSSTTDAPAPNAATDAMDVDEASSSDHRPVAIFSAPTSSTPVAAHRQDEDEAFMPDISSAKAHQRLLKAAGENKRLLSDQELEARAAADAARMAAVKSVRIRARFPDNFSAEWRFGPADTGATLYAEVRSIMARPDLPFRLALPPPLPGNTSSSSGKNALIRDDPDTTLIQGYRLSANTLVNFLWDDAVPADVRKRPFLKDSAAGRAQQVVVPDVPDVEVGGGSSEGAGPASAASRPRNDGGEAGGGGTAFKKPKWLKGFGKK
ncbi:GLUT4 regulating protein TUG-domain-containing protein [Biscogniauxia mediterranea]|nr:GLUT4 regulating protein TUG-domain-containing protein [Biscogniauxia mediterranea]